MCSSVCSVLLHKNTDPHQRRLGMRWALRPVAATLTLSAFFVLTAQQEAALAPPHPPGEPAAVVAPAASEKARAGGGGGHAKEDPQPTAGVRVKPTCNDPLVLVDRSHPLPDGYVPDDLVPLASYGVPILGGRQMQLRRESAEALRGMVDAAAADGEELVVASAYRSYAEQQDSHTRLMGIYGEEAMSAPPGHSQHQLGTAVDLTNSAVGFELSQAFGATSSYAWLSEHAGEHGFVLAYPPDGEDETGYGWEPWHFRYVGTDNAGRVSQSGLDLQGFLKAEGVPPRC